MRLRDQIMVVEEYYKALSHLLDPGALPESLKAKEAAQEAALAKRRGGA